MTVNTSRAAQKLIADLRSSDPMVIDASLKQIATKGERSLVMPLLELLLRSSDPAIRKEVLTLLGDINDKTVVDILIEGLMREDMSTIRKDILSVIWNADLPAGDHLEVLVAIAIEGDLEVRLECLTIIEQLTAAPPEEEVMNSLLLLREFMATNRADQQDIMHDIHAQVMRWERIA